MSETDPQDNRPTLLLVDDDAVFCGVLARALAARGFEVRTAHQVDAACALAQDWRPEFAIVDLKLPHASGLTVVQALKAIDDTTRILVLTGYASIATAVEAIKLGATHYLAKPADADEILAALGRAVGDVEIEVKADPVSVDRLEWEHIQRVLAEQNGNVTATARALKMHRRTLQRKLSKRPVRE